MKVLIDLYKAKDPFSGLGQFSLQFARQLLKSEPSGFEFHFLLPADLKLNGVEEERVLRAGFSNRHFSFLNRNFDLWHSLQQFPSYYPSKGTKQILTIHDLNFLKEKDASKASKYLSKLQNNIDRAAGVTTISEFTKSEILKECSLRGKEVEVVYNGVEDLSDAVKAPKRIPLRSFFFSIGIFSEKKNFHHLVEMMEHIEDKELVIAGRNNTNYGQQIRIEIERLNLQERVYLAGTISDEEKHWYYENCEAFLFPSSAEGFGMPVIEALQHGKPTVLSNLTALPEIGGEEAFYFDSLDPEMMAVNTKHALQISSQKGSAFKDQMKTRAGKFSWQSSIDAYIEFYRKIAS